VSASPTSFRTAFATGIPCPFAHRFNAAASFRVNRTESCTRRARADRGRPAGLLDLLPGRGPGLCRRPLGMARASGGRAPLQVAEFVVDLHKQMT